MRYLGQSDFSHQQSPKIGVLITNLGTPDAPTTPALRRYLAEFLADPRVVEFPRWLWRIILHGIILRVRPRRSAEAYSSVWTDEGSPLLIITKAQKSALASRLAEKYGDDVVVDFAMRYGNPGISSVIDRMLKAGVRRLLVLPLYPQYSGATTGSTFDVIAQDFTQRRWLPELRYLTHYHDKAGYINALVAKIRAFQAEHGQPDQLIFSYHGIPLRYLKNGDPYHCECYKTTRLVAEALGLSDDQYMTTFQSRFGREEWLKPYTDETLKSLPGKGVKSVQVICPGFSADCLETIEEIDEENREYFMESGGKSYAYIPALNDDSSHIDFLETFILENLQGWEVDTQSVEATEKAYQKRVAQNL